jgi:hypothetical protein
MEEIELGYNDIDAITDSTSRKWTDKKKIDTLLEISANLWATTGSDSSLGEIKAIKKMQRDIYRCIKRIDKPLGDLLLRYEG